MTPPRLPGFEDVRGIMTDKLPSAEERAKGIRLYVHSIAPLAKLRSWDDVRAEIAEVIRSDRNAVLEAAAEIAANDKYPSRIADKIRKLKEEK